MCDWIYTEQKWIDNKLWDSISQVLIEVFLYCNVLFHLQIWTNPFVVSANWFIKLLANSADPD
ncbi:MAG: hypothetical protein KZQ70_09305, partial [gamma proteobacterium symbiont of Lucinoma myriamae]|nr:hypothetical protein [gamma proteobacterium symbiont of Lucinoma myriamae]